MPFQIFSLLFVLLFTFTIGPVNGQENQITISGKVLDEQTKEALSFASIYIEGTTIGTTSNLEGSFVFHIPAEHQSDKVVISMIGYHSVQRLISTFNKKPIVYLSGNVYGLVEIVVTPGAELTAKQILKKAYRVIEDNYPSQPYIIEGFIRDV